ncbi:MAG: 7-cyano-7-deazaguanine synthase QueC [Candidatus Schekmanbacteria bacterium]|nr:7-cyano-7-deazaguanine synthase QueC [Candidatus Schekmanbacteria bacterium]
MPKAVVLLSGGLDSSTCLAMARQQRYTSYALSFNYGQRHARELESARKVANALQVKEHLIIDINLRSIGGSALTADISVPKARPAVQIGAGIPVTYVPARNTIFLSLALAWAEVLETGHIFIGVNALDYSGYPDCRPEYIRAFEQMANLATKAAAEGKCRYRIHTPLINMSKAQIIREGCKLGLDYGLTYSCYDPLEGNHPCGQCDSCLLRLKGFKEAGLTDPLVSVKT